MGKERFRIDFCCHCASLVRYSTAPATNTSQSVRRGDDLQRRKSVAAREGQNIANRNRQLELIIAPPGDFMHCQTSIKTHRINSDLTVKEYFQSKLRIDAKLVNLHQIDLSLSNQNVRMTYNDTKANSSDFSQVPTRPKLDLAHPSCRQSCVLLSLSAKFQDSSCTLSFLRFFQVRTRRV